MTTGDPEIAGEKEEDKRLWRTYFHWARQAAHCRPVPNEVKDKENERLPERQSDSLQLIVFSAFLIEYRMKRALAFMHQRVRERDNLRSLLGFFWKRLESVKRCKGDGYCAPPQGWDQCAKQIEKLSRLRNLIVHADCRNLLVELNEDRAEATARRHYNNVVDAMKLINKGTGYSTGEPSDADEYWDRLKCQEQP